MSFHQTCHNLHISPLTKYLIIGEIFLSNQLIIIKRAFYLTQASHYPATILSHQVCYQLQILPSTKYIILSYISSY